MNQTPSEIKIVLKGEAKEGGGVETLRMLKFSTRELVFFL